MKRQRPLVIIVVIILAGLIGLVSLGANHRLTKSDIAFNPYKVGDTLVFQSDQRESDTLIIYSADRQVLREKCYSFLTCIYSYLTVDSWEGLYVDVRTPTDHWTGTNILTVRAEPNGTKTIYFNLILKNAWWYGDNEDDLDKIKLLTKETFKHSNNVFSDVVTIISKNKEYLDRPDYIEKIYWSKSYGFVGFDKLNGEKWIVTKK